jgi:hypothetical protein
MTDPHEIGRAARFAQRSPVAWLLLAASMIGAVLVILGAFVEIWRYVDDETGPSWPETEYKKVRSLTLGLNITWYEDLLGEPIAMRKSEVDPQPWRLHVFKRRGWLALLVVEQDGHVSQWNVVACSKQFQPTFDDGAERTKRSAKLNVSSLADVSSRLPDRSVRLPAAGGGTGYWEGDNWVNRNGGTATMWGVVSVCSRVPEPAIDTGVGWDCPDQHEHELPICPVGDDPSAEGPFMKRLRATRSSWQMPVNMWGACQYQCQYTVGAHLEIDRSDLEMLTQPPT